MQVVFKYGWKCLSRRARGVSTAPELAQNLLTVKSVANDVASQIERKCPTLGLHNHAFRSGERGRYFCPR
jgi:hypothetical protein